MMWGAVAGSPSPSSKRGAVIILDGNADGRSWPDRQGILNVSLFGWRLPRIRGTARGVEGFPRRRRLARDPGSLIWPRQASDTHSLPRLGTAERMPRS